MKIYANKIKKSEINFNNAKIYWFSNSKNQLIGIISYGTLSFDDTVVLYSATSQRFISFLNKNLENTKGTVYYICD